jgi:UDP-N-acetylmuramoylalanine--D-glutamate ligase
MVDFSGKRVLIIGAARQGLALTRFLLHKGALVTVTDMQRRERLQESISSFGDSPVTWALGGHPLELLDGTSLVCVSGGVPLTLPLIQEAERRGIPVTNDSEIFMQAVKAPVIGITGSAGKTTTTTLVGRMAAAGAIPPRIAWVGGNIGNPLIELVEKIDAHDLVILELSSFQLEQMTTSPHIAAVLNITPNHLDRHGTMAEYIRAKSHILVHQNKGDIAVLNRDDPESWNLRDQVRGSLISFGRALPASDEIAVFVEDGNVVLLENGKRSILLEGSAIELRGAHNLMNVLAACAIAHAAGLSPQAMRVGVSGFKGVKHRQELVREHNGVCWVNDSIASAPERTIAALNVFTGPLVLLLGGRDKNLPWDTLAAMIHQRVDHVVIFGESADKIADAISLPVEGDRLSSVVIKRDFIAALEESRRISEPGDVVLLSPGCTSYDAFKDFEERGETFRNWVNGLS